MIYADEDLVKDVQIDEYRFDPIDVAMMFVMLEKHEAKEFVIPEGPLNLIKRLIEQRHIPSRRQVEEAKKLEGAFSRNPLRG